MAAMSISKLVGQIVVSITGMKEGSDEITLITASGDEFRLYHGQGCCEHVRVVDVAGDPKDLIGSPILLAEESEGETPSDYTESLDDAYQWTFYRFATVNGYVSVRWLGESNGYYGTGVDLLINGKSV
jgi:hypothetical protein